MNAVPEFSLNHDYLIDNFRTELEPFLGLVPEDNHANIKAHIAWYNEEDHETVWVVNAKTSHFPVRY